MSNRERILEGALQLFNEKGATAVSTNHIAERIGISPGNLYFHFRNKEEIVRELFARMTQEVTTLLEDVRKAPRVTDPEELVARIFPSFWKYRCFHREIYALRRADAVLTRHWRFHVRRSFLLVREIYRRWESAGLVRRLRDGEEMELFSTMLLVLSGSFLQAYESSERRLREESLARGIRMTSRFLDLYRLRAASRPARARSISVEPSRPRRLRSLRSI